MLGVAFGSVQMCFKLPDFLSQRVEACDEGLLLGEWWQWNFNTKKLIWTDGFTPCAHSFCFSLKLPPDSIPFAIPVKETRIKRFRISAKSWEYR